MKHLPLIRPYRIVILASAEEVDHLKWLAGKKHTTVAQVARERLFVDLKVRSRRP